MIAAFTGRVKAFLAFWYDFVVGDDWRVAAGVAAALALTYAASRGSSTVWWIVPLAVVVLLVWSLARAIRSR